MPEPRVFRNERLRYIARCLAAEWGKPDRFSRLFIDRLALPACIDFLRLGREGRGRGAGRLARRQLRRVTEYVIERVSEAVRLRELSAIAGLSPSQFGRAWEASTGLAPHRWQLNARIAKAQELLLADSLPLSEEIALVTGFAEQSHFTRVFRNRTGTSPGAWRREQRQPDPVSKSA